MKKRIAKICASVLILLLVAIVTGCGSTFYIEKNKIANDDISKAIYKAVGRKKVYYQNKEYSNSGEIVVYDYLVRDYGDENLLTDITEAVNAVMKEKEITQKIHLSIREKMVGGYESVASLCNYHYDENKYEQYETLQILRIYGTDRSDMGDNSPYNKASTYINLPDIKSLFVTEKIAQNAEEEGIDWYEVWPDLESYEVLGSSEN